ncbi:hypothetical protein N8772_01220 [Rickettsiales bacterium]|nr:hypothetical protein [Rickettsiales bacterium]
MVNNFIILSLLLFLFSSCVSIKKTGEQSYKKEIKDIYQKRVNLFPKLSQKEIKKRQNKSLPTFDNNWHDKNSAAAIIKSSIIDSINNNKKFIEIDLRYYRSVGLGNIMFSAIADEDLSNFLYFSKFDQQFFILFNFSQDRVTIINGQKTPYDFDILYIKGNIKDKEIIFNVSNSKSVQCNIKFTPQQPIFSFLADNIKTAPCDIREISNSLQNFLYNITTLDYIGTDWNMKLFSINGSNYAHNGGTPKFTHGLIENVMNDNIVNLDMGSFKYMKIGRYHNNESPKFKYKERSD